MQTQTWGMTPKSQIDNEKIEEAIDRIVQAHDDDPDAHLDAGQALQSHRASEVIDHLAESIVNDKIVNIARAYTAIVKIPSTTNENIFFSGIEYTEQNLVVVSPDKTITEILGRVDSGDDSEYVYLPVDASGFNYFVTQPATIPDGKSVYSVKLKFRAKIINDTVASESVSILYYDGNSESLYVSNVWADYEHTFYSLMDSDDNWAGINQDTLNTAYFGISSDQVGGDSSKNQIAISKCYLEIAVTSDIDNKDFCNVYDAVNYCNSLGGGSIFIKNGTYILDGGSAYINSFIDIYGESLEGCILHCDWNNQIFYFGGGESPKYTTGTITLTQNSAVVVASGVTWTSANTIGKYLLDRRSGHYYLIVSREDSTHITLGESYQGNTASSLEYIIVAMTNENSLHDITLETGFTCQGSINCLIENVNIVGHKPNLLFCENVVVRDCDITGSSSTVDLYFVSNSKFIDNTIKGCSQTPFHMPIDCVGNTFDNNLFIDNKFQCILIYGFNNILKGNTFLNNGWTAGQLYPPVLLGASSYKNLVSNNIIRNNNSYGIGSQAGANYNICLGNICIDNYSAGISNAGANSLTVNNIV